MKLNTIVIPCLQDVNAPNLTFIHGWAAESTVWQEWVTDSFSNNYNITLIDLPGSGNSPTIKKSKNIEDEWLELLAEALPEKTHLLGWSLGGLLAQKLAFQYPNKITSLVCLASTPRFTQNDGWKRSVSPKIIADFIKSVGIEVNGLLKRFWQLQLQGSDNSRQLMKELVKHMSKRKIPKIIPLNQGLILLKDMDNRDILKQITQPTLWLLGEKDPLIPQAIRLNLTSLQPFAQVEIIEGCSHIPFFSHPKQTADILLKFWSK